jgi:ABC-type sugar transport system permease subunit
VVCALFLSFCDWNALAPAEFVGLDNFVYMFTKDSTLLIAVKNSIFL